jgi:hypothetical protein
MICLKFLAKISALFMFCFCCGTENDSAAQSIDLGAQGFFRTVAVEKIVISEQEGMMLPFHILWKGQHEEVFATIALNAEKGKIVISELINAKGEFVDRRITLKCPKNLMKSETIEKVIVHHGEYWFLVSDHVIRYDFNFNFLDNVDLREVTYDLFSFGENLITVDYSPGAAEHNGSIQLKDAEFNTKKELFGLYQNDLALVFNKSNIVDVAENSLVYAPMDGRMLYLLNSEFERIDSLILEIPFWKNDSIWSVNQVKSASIAEIKRIRDQGFTNIHDVQFMNDSTIIIGYLQDMNCGGEILVKIKDGKLFQLDNKITDRGVYWFAAPDLSDRQLQVRDVEYHLQLNAGFAHGNKLYTLERGKEISMVGTTASSWHKYSSRPMKDLMMYFYFLVAEFE